MNYYRLLVALNLMSLMPYAAIAGEGLVFEIKHSQKNEAVEVLGGLNCIQPEVNTGEACSLQIVEASSQKVYRVADSNKAMEMFFSGKRKVKLTGKLTASGTLSVLDIQAL